MAMVEKREITDADIDHLTGQLRAHNDAHHFIAGDHPVAYSFSVAAEHDGLVQNLPATDEWPPDPATIIDRLQQVSLDPHVDQQTLNITIRNLDNTRHAYLLAAPMFPVTSDGEYCTVAEPLYFISYGQYIETVRREDLHETPALLAPELVASEEDALHAAWTGGRRAPHPDGRTNRFRYYFDHHPLTLGKRTQLPEVIQYIWATIDNSPSLDMDNGLTEFELAILNGPPERTTAMPRYPEIPIPPEVTELQRSYVCQWAADDPTANLATEVVLGRLWPLTETAKLLAGVLPEIAPYAFINLAELREANARRRRQ